jgi:hypothetical protein
VCPEDRHASRPRNWMHVAQSSMAFRNQNSEGLSGRSTPRRRATYDPSIALLCACVAASCAPIIGIDELERVECLGNCSDASAGKDATRAGSGATANGGASGEVTGAGGFAADDGGGTAGDGGSSVDSGQPPPPDAAIRDADATNWYQIRNHASGLCLDNLGSTSTFSSFSIVERACASVASQQWTLAPASGGCSHVINRSSDLCLNNRGSLTSQTTIGQYSCSTSSTNINWSVPSAGASGHIVSCKSGQCVAAPTDGSTAIVQDVCDNSSSQTWSLVAAGY